MVKFFSKYMALFVLLFAFPLVVCCGLENMVFDRHSEIKMVNNDEMSVLTCWLSESSNMQYHPYFNTSMELALDERCTRVDTGEKKTIMRLARIDAYESISFERYFEDLGPQYLAIYKFHWGEYTEEDLLGIYELTLEQIKTLYKWELCYPMLDETLCLTVEELYDRSGIKLVDNYLPPSDGTSAYPHNRI